MVRAVATVHWKCRKIKLVPNWPCWLGSIQNVTTVKFKRIGNVCSIGYKIAVLSVLCFKQSIRRSGLALLSQDWSMNTLWLPTPRFWVRFCQVQAISLEIGVPPRSTRMVSVNKPEPAWISCLARPLRSRVDDTGKARASPSLSCWSEVNTVCLHKQKCERC